MEAFVARSVAANRGDLASQAGIVDGLLSSGLVSKVYVSSHYPHHFKQSDVCPVKPAPLKGYFITSEERVVLFKTSVVLWGGGVDLQDSGSKLKLVFVWMRFFLISRFTSSFILANQGAGPIKSTLGRILSRYALKYITYANLREPTAYQLVSEMSSLNANCIKLSVDAALMLDSPNGSFGAAYLGEKGFDVGQPIIGINIRRWFHQKGGWLPTVVYRRKKESELNGKIEQLVKNLAECLDKLNKDGFKQITLIPMYRAHPEPWEDDIFLLNAVTQAMQSDSRFVMIDEDVTTHELISIMSCCDVIIGGRLHSTILAHIAGVPSVHIAYEHKGVEYYMNMNQQEYLVDINDAVLPGGHLALYSKVIALVKNSSLEKERIGERVKNLRIKAIDDLKSAILAVGEN